MQSRMSRAVPVAIVALLASLISSPSTIEAAWAVDCGETRQKAIWFYDPQRSSDLPAAKCDWAASNQADDHSYRTSGSLIDFDQVTAYSGGTLSRGVEP